MGLTRSSCNREATQCRWLNWCDGSFCLLFGWNFIICLLFIQFGWDNLQNWQAYIFRHKGTTNQWFLLVLFWTHQRGLEKVRSQVFPVVTLLALWAYRSTEVSSVRDCDMWNNINETIILSETILTSECRSIKKSQHINETGSRLNNNMRSSVQDMPEKMQQTWKQPGQAKSPLRKLQLAQEAAFN